MPKRSWIKEEETNTRKHGIEEEVAKNLFLNCWKSIHRFLAFKKCRTWRTARSERRRGLADMLLSDNSAGRKVFPLLLRLPMIIWRNWNVSRLSGAESGSIGSDLRILELLFVVLQITPIEPRHSELCAWRSGKVKGFSLSWSNSSENWKPDVLKCRIWNLKMKIFNQSTIKRAIK